MPIEQNSRVWVRTTLPWVIAAGACILYLVTLNHWVNMKSLPVVAKVTGWDWTWPAQWPLFFLLTFPFRFLPSSVAPVALNVFTAICGGLTLYLLVRSVALLPHDRTQEQRLRERSENSLLSIKLAWLPPLLAALVCGLELTFWEHSTAVTGEVLDLLVFAYLVRCLLEYRLDPRESRLYRFALVYGLGVTNNWALIGFFPLFLVSLIWIKGISFFKARFVLTMTGLGFAGLLLYLLLPIVWAFSKNPDITFWDVLRANWMNQKMFLFNARPLRSRALLLSLTSIFPVLIMGVRWGSVSGETSMVGAALTTFLFRLFHLVFLAAGLCVAFDKQFSPRALGYGLPFLPFYYLGALAIGYYSGYALLVFRDLQRKGWRPSGISVLLNPVIRGAVLLAFVAVPLGLLWQNWKVIQASNGQILKQFARSLVDQLPKEAYVFSDDPFELLLVEGYLEGVSPGHKHILVNTKSLDQVSYQKELDKHYGDRWPRLTNIDEFGQHLSPGVLQMMVSTVAESNQIVYLHPSFGYYFEKMYPTPKGDAFFLTLYKTNQVTPPALTPGQISENQSFWDKTENYLQKIERLGKLDSNDARYLASYYSRGINTWGVSLQRSGKVSEAGKKFEEAYRLNTNNVAAQINRDFNKTIRDGKGESKQTPQTLEEQLGKYRAWDNVLFENGDFDEPYVCLQLGSIFQNQGYMRQSIQELNRTLYFQPTNFFAHLSLTRAYVSGGWPDLALEHIAQVRKEFPNLSETNKVELIALEASGHFAKKDVQKAEEQLQQARAAHPEDPLLLQSLFEMYNISGNYTNALTILDEQLKRNPTNSYTLMQKAETLSNLGENDKAKALLDDIIAREPNHVPALLYKGFLDVQTKNLAEALGIADKVLRLDPDNVQAMTYQGIAYMEQKQYDKAIEIFDKALGKQPGNTTIRRNRAIANLGAGHLDDAESDYQTLKQAMPGSHVVYYGLGEVAYRKKKFTDAARYFQSYLKYAPKQGSKDLQEERKEVEGKLQEIKGKK